MPNQSARRAALRVVANLAVETALAVQAYFALLWAVLRGFVTRPRYGRDFVQALDRIGVSSLFIVVLAGLFTGMVLALQSSVELERFGAVIYIGRLVGAGTVRQMGPVLTALIVTGRAGAGMAATIGAMRVTEQVDALRTMGVDPVRRLVVPRVAASLVMLPILTVIADLVGVLGGGLVSVLKYDLTMKLYLGSVVETLASGGFVLGVIPSDLVRGLAKPLAFGGIMALTSCFHGLRTSGGTEGVGRATTHAVVWSSILILAADYFITQILIVTLPP